MNLLTNLTYEPLQAISQYRPGELAIIEFICERIKTFQWIPDGSVYDGYPLNLEEDNRIIKSLEWKVDRVSRICEPTQPVASAFANVYVIFYIHKDSPCGIAEINAIAVFDNNGKFQGFTGSSLFTTSLQAFCEQLFVDSSS